MDRHKRASSIEEKLEAQDERTKIEAYQQDGKLREQALADLDNFDVAGLERLFDSVDDAHDPSYGHTIEGKVCESCRLFFTHPVTQSFSDEGRKTGSAPDAATKRKAPAGKGKEKDSKPSSSTKLDSVVVVDTNKPKSDKTDLLLMVQQLQQTMVQLALENQKLSKQIAALGRVSDESAIPDYGTEHPGDKIPKPKNRKTPRRGGKKKNGKGTSEQLESLSDATLKRAHSLRTQECQTQAPASSGRKSQPRPKKQVSPTTVDLLTQHKDQVNQKPVTSKTGSKKSTRPRNGKTRRTGDPSKGSSTSLKKTSTLRAAQATLTV